MVSQYVNGKVKGQRECLVSKMNNNHYEISFDEITQCLTKTAAARPKQPRGNKRDKKKARR